MHAILQNLQTLVHGAAICFLQVVELLRKADFRHLEDGWLEDGFETYWIRGC